MKKTYTAWISSGCSGYRGQKFSVPVGVGAGVAPFNELIPKSTVVFRVLEFTSDRVEPVGDYKLLQHGAAN